MSDDNLQSTSAQIMHQNAQIIDALDKILDELKYIKLQPYPVKIENINMSFIAMVGFLIKISLAAIPAGILIFIIYYLAIAFISMTFSGGALF